MKSKNFDLKQIKDAYKNLKKKTVGKSNSKTTVFHNKTLLRKFDFYTVFNFLFKILYCIFIFNILI